MPIEGDLSDMQFTPAQCRAARGFLGWSMDDLARQSGVTRTTIHNFEAGRHELQQAKAEALLNAFTGAGIMFSRNRDKHSVHMQIPEGSGI